ncbi:MAG: TrkH family potassium uptake protein [Bacteroidales bacterium]|nr:TrkH family potassium uptake protein [Bacteroidales bacterium]
MARLLGLLLLVMAFALLPAIVVSVVVDDGVWAGLMAAFVLFAVLGVAGRNWLGRHALYQMTERESFWVTAVVWLFIPVMGAFPYLFAEIAISPLDALFESFSGFTTTGSTIFDEPALLPPSLLVWRATTQWVGGGGLLLLVVALFSRMHDGSFFLYDAEFSGTVQQRLHPHLSVTVRKMFVVYAGGTLILFLLLLLLGNGFVNSLCVSLATLSTGGFMTSSSGLAGFGIGSQAVVSFFMLISGVNLALVYSVCRRQWRPLRESDEFHWYIAIFACCVLLTAAMLYTAGNDIVQSLRYAVFHVAATISTCGFYIDTPSCWSFGVVIITFLLLFVGACTGSTGGGIKVKRVQMVARYIRNYFTRMVHPRAVFAVKLDGIVISDDYINKIFAFVFMYLAFVLGGAFALMVTGVDLSSALVMAAANMCNLGPTPLTGDLGVTVGYSLLPSVAKLTLMVLMVAGRIEIFALAALFSRSYWNRIRR